MPRISSRTSDHIGSQASAAVDDLRKQLSVAHNRLTQEIESYNYLESMAQHEANMAVQENESVNQLHVKLQEQRVAGFQAKAEVKRKRLETEPIGVNNQSETGVAEMNEMSHRYDIVLKSLKYKLDVKPMIMN